MCTCQECRPHNSKVVLQYDLEHNVLAKHFLASLFHRCLCRCCSISRGKNNIENDCVLITEKIEYLPLNLKMLRQFWCRICVMDNIRRLNVFNIILLEIKKNIHKSVYKNSMRLCQHWMIAFSPHRNVKVRFSSFSSNWHNQVVHSRKKIILIESNKQTSK